MSDVDVLRELTRTLRPPAFDELVAVARKRRRRGAMLAAGCAVIVVLGSGIAAASLWEGREAVGPAQDPSLMEWTPERTRAEGSPVDLLAGRSGPSSSGLDAQLYCTGEAIPTGSPCDPYYPYNPQLEQHWAVEVTQGGQSALYDVEGTPLIQDFDEDSLLVQDGPDDQARLRLLQADGTAVQLRVLRDPALASPGPDVRLIPDLTVYRRGSIGPEDIKDRPYLVDERAGTLQPLDVPKDIKWWGPNVEEFLWGGNGCQVIWQRLNGSFDHHDAECRDLGAVNTDPGLNWTGFADWLEPGRLALVEWNNNGVPRVVHASLDRGANWERVEIEDRQWGDTLDEIADALDEALRPLE